MTGMVTERDFRKLAPATQAELRRIAVAMVRAGKTRLEAAATVGVNRRFVGRWVQAAAQRGEAALVVHPASRIRLLWVWSVTRGAGPGWGGCDDAPGARVERGGGAQAGADDALTEAGRGTGSPGADRAARGRGAECAGDRGQDGPVRRHGALLAQALQRARPFWAGGGHALGAPADLHRRGAQRGYRCGAVAARRSGSAVRVVDAGPLGGLLGREGHRHEAQPDERGSPRRGAEVAPGGDLVRDAGGPGVRA